MDSHVNWLRRRIVTSIATQTAATFAVVAVVAFVLLLLLTKTGVLSAFFGSVLIAQLVAIIRVLLGRRNSALSYNYKSMRTYVENPFTYRVARFTDEGEEHPVAQKLLGFTPVATIRDEVANPPTVFDVYRDQSNMIAASVDRSSGVTALMSSLSGSRILYTAALPIAPHEKLVVNTSASKESVVTAHRLLLESRADAVELQASAHQLVLDALTYEYESYQAIGSSLSSFLDFDGPRLALPILARVRSNELAGLPELLGPDLKAILPPDAQSVPEPAASAVAASALKSAPNLPEVVAAVPGAGELAEVPDFSAFGVESEVVAAVPGAGELAEMPAVPDVPPIVNLETFGDVPGVPEPMDVPGVPEPIDVGAVAPSSEVPSLLDVPKPADTVSGAETASAFATDRTKIAISDVLGAPVEPASYPATPDVSIEEVWEREVRASLPDSASEVAIGELCNAFGAQGDAFDVMVAPATNDVVLAELDALIAEAKAHEDSQRLADVEPQQIEAPKAMAAVEPGPAKSGNVTDAVVPVDPTALVDHRAIPAIGLPNKPVAEPRARTYEVPQRLVTPDSIVEPIAQPATLEEAIVAAPDSPEALMTSATVIDSSNTATSAPADGAGPSQVGARTESASQIQRSPRLRLSEVMESHPALASNPPARRARRNDNDA